MKYDDKELIHKHFRMGHGKYRLIGIWSSPSKSALETNPMGYNETMAERPKCCHMVCDHCGTGIMHHFILEDENKEQFSVGSSCIEKLGQYDLVTAAQKMEKERQRKLRLERAEKKRAEKEAKYEYEIEEQRKKNGGLTDYEVLLEERNQRELDNEKKYVELSTPIVALLEKAGGDFCNNMADTLRKGSVPSGGAKRIVIEVITKQYTGARKNSKAYNTALPEMKSLFELVESQFKTIRESHLTYLNKTFGLC
ncbi:hypothetical protein [Photobacterium damselae]|uniref:hypothetical protein n=1 Tax=Photobacterium damselae TaxID=38293 RepID=UPI001F208AA6|nr:hypothetical protein [Photobacterium damselae]UKA04746.1 hypothetical protein IHC89_21125 [Photobacterium damselae subsp. damselae]